ncbi:MAG TPA: hypothetical protein VHW24_27625 [Bryobacteraceae bacterium]|nr:hypothetical protein [Bryobacteraceae bacterium]
MIRRVAGLLVLSLFLLGAQNQAGNQTFHIPQGWIQTDSARATILSPSAELKDAVALVLSGHPFTGDFRAAFDQDVKAMNGALRVLRGSEVQGRRTADGVDLLATTVDLQAANRASPKRFYMAASVRGRYELMVYTAATPALFQRYWPAVQQFISTWTFANLNTPAAPPAEAVPTAPLPGAPKAPALETSPAPAGVTPPNRLEGLYLGYKYNYVTVLGVVQRKAVNDYFSFFPNGEVYWGLPQTGLVAFSMATACAGGKADFCGTYRINGEQLSIVLNRGTYRQGGSVAGGTLQIEDRKYTLQGDPSKSSAHTLEGDFGRADAQPGEDLARRFIHFTRDGRFVDQGIVTTVVSSDISSGNPRFERAAGSGTYNLAPYTLILHYSDGYQRQLGIYVAPSDMEKPALSQFFVNTYSLVRRR